MKPSIEVPIERLWEVFDADFERGLLIRKKITGPRAKLGVATGSKNTKGYLQIKLDGQKITVHRIIWSMKYGVWPQNQIDHINGDKADNRIENLREVSQSQNKANTSVSYKNNKLGIKGVSLHKKIGKFKAQIQKNGKNIHLGYFNTPEEAHSAYVAASQQFYGEYSPFSNQRGE